MNSRLVDESRGWITLYATADADVDADDDNEDED